MGLFSNWRRSWEKSSRLRELELVIAPSARSTDDLLSELRRFVETGVNDEDRALEAFLDLCQADEGVKAAMEAERLTRADLEQIYLRLLGVGLGRWVKGHYAALSSIAYFEPLLYAARAQKREAVRPEMARSLLQYWENKIPRGGLLEMVQQ